MGNDEEKMTANKENIILAKHVFLLFNIDGPSDSTTCPVVGTGFGIARPGIVLTAAHVVKGVPRNLLQVVSAFYNPALSFEVDEIVNHPDADIAALVIRGGESLEYFELGEPPSGHNDIPLAEDVLSYGFPILAGERPIWPRMMKGHIQRHYQHVDEEYRYSAYELGFPAFPGQSGSPIFLDKGRNIVVGMVTNSVSYGSECGDSAVNVSWATGIALIPLADWIRSL